jgi:hypothetical protein
MMSGQEKMSRKTSKPGLAVVGNVMSGRGTFIRVPGYQYSIEAKANIQIGDGTFTDASPEKPRDDANRASFAEKLAPSVLAGLILETIKNAVAFPRRCLGL